LVGKNSYFYYISTQKILVIDLALIRIVDFVGGLTEGGIIKSDHFEALGVGVNVILVSQG